MKVYRDVLDATTGVVTKTPIFNIMEGTYSGQDMGERSITATIEFPTPIDFHSGDYVEFDIADLIRGENVEGGHFVEKFYIYTMPTVKKIASSMSAGNAFEHTVTFYPRQYELGCTQMRDLAQAANSGIIYTGYDEFSFYGGAKTLMDRIICVLRERFGEEGTAGVDYWDYVISDSINEERNTALEKFQFDFSGNSVMEAIVKLNDTDGINTKFWINERMIYVGFKRPYICGVNEANVLRTIPFDFKYGKTSHLPISTNYGNLFTITKSLGSSSPITRLYAYGSDRNLHRFYCSDRMKSGRYINKLMLPSFGNDGKTDYVDSVEGIAKFGIREGSKTFDDIYPSLRYFTYGDLRSVQYCIKMMGSGLENDTNVYEEGTEYTYPVARVQCYRVEALSGTKVNHLVECAPPVDLAVFCHATGKSVKVILYAAKDGKTALQRQQEAAGVWDNGNYRVPAHTLHGTDYIEGSAFAVHDSGYECGHTHDLYVGTVGNKRQDNTGVALTRDDWFVDIDSINTKKDDDATTTDQAKLKYKNEVEIHQINYTDTHWITDIFEFTSYDQTTFQRQGYSAYCYSRINNTYPSSQSDNTDVSAIVDISPVIIEDTDLNVSEGKQQDYVDVFLRDVGFQINEQTWFGDYTFLFDTCKVSFLDGNLAGYELTVCKESQSKKLADIYIPALLEDGSENPTFFESADYMDEVRIRKAYESGAFWRIKLLRTETDIDNYWLPNVNINASAGDHVVFLSIYMPDVYQRVAERRLEKEARKYLDANDDGDIQYTFDFDKVRMLQVPAFGLQIREGAIMRVVDDDLDIKTLNSKRTAFSDSVGMVSRKSLYLTEIVGEDATKVWYTLEYRDFLYIKNNICTNYTDKYPTGWSVIPLDGVGLNPKDTSAGFVPSNTQITGYIKLPLSKEDYESIKKGDKEVVFSNNRIEIRLGEYSHNNSSHGDVESCFPYGYSYLTGIVDGIDVYYENSYKAEVIGLPSSLSYGTVGVKFHLESSCALKYYYRKGRTDYPIIAGWGEYAVRTKHTEDYTAYKANPYLMPRGTRFFCPAQQLTEFKANKYYEVTMDCENTTMPYFDVNGNRTLFALINNIGEGATWFVPEYTAEEITDFSDSKSWRRFVFKFTLEDTFNDSQDYYPAILYVSDGHTESVSVRLLSIIESDANGLTDLNYADLNIDTVTIKFNDNTRQHGVMLQNGVEPSRRVANNVTPMLREITATVKEESRASTWMQMMSRISDSEILGNQIIKTQETLANAARRRYLELLSLKNAIFDPDGTCDQTFLQVMMLQVGADSMNYQLDKTKQAAGTLALSNCRILQTSGAEDKFQIFSTDVLRHYVYTQNEPAGTWYVAAPANSTTAGVLSEFDLTQVTDDGKEYYYPTYFVAIKCAIHDSKSATWVCEPTQHKVNEDDEYYYFNWGILIPDSEGHYSLTETRGNAYMYGDNLICGKISTLAGQSYFDLTHGNFVLSDGTSTALSYVNGVLTINGVTDNINKVLERLDGLESLAIGGENVYSGDDITIRICGSDVFGDKAEKYRFMYFYTLEANATVVVTAEYENPDTATLPNNLYVVAIPYGTGGLNEECPMLLAGANDYYLPSPRPTPITYLPKMKAYELGTPISSGSTKQLLYFFAKDSKDNVGTVYLYSGSVYARNIMVQYGTKATAYQPYIEHVAKALVETAVSDGSTQIAGGLTLTNILMLKDENKNVVAGMSGLSSDSEGNTDNVHTWSGGDYATALEAATQPLSAQTTIPVLLCKDGSGMLANGNLRWNAEGRILAAGGKVVIEKDGSGSVADSKIKWDSNGNVTMNNVTMNDITANSGTFAGKIVADNGLRYGVKITSTEYTIKTTDSLIVCKYGCEKLYFPKEPNAGQILTIVNLCQAQDNISTNEVIVYCQNGQLVLPSWSDAGWSYNIEGGNASKLRFKESRQFVYAGTYWYQIIESGI